MDSHDLLTAAEVAKKLRISKWQVYQYVNQGVLPPGVSVRLGRSVRFDETELQSWIKRGGQKTAQGENARLAT